MILNHEEIFTSEIISNNMQSFHVVDDHYCKSLEAKISLEGLEQIGWFRKRIELIAKDAKNFIKFFNPKTKEPILEEEEDQKRIKYYYPGSLPTKDVFKIACLNKTFKKKVESFFAPYRFNDFLKYYNCIKFTDVLAKPPNFDEFA